MFALINCRQVRRHLRHSEIGWLTIALMVAAPPGRLDAGSDNLKLSPPWQNLPEETVVAVRVPNADLFLKTFKQNTKLGGVLLNNERLEQFKSLITDQAPELWQTFEKDLAKHKLTVEDLPKLLAGAWGTALVLHQSQDAEPLPIMLSWIDPGADLARWALDAVSKIIEDRKDDKHLVRRVDFQLAGHRILQFKVPMVRYKFDELAFNWPDNGQDLIDEKQRDIRQQWQQKPQESRRGPIRHLHVLLAHMGGRLLAANTFPLGDAMVEVEQLEHLTAIFSHFLAGQADDDGGFIASMTSADTVREALPQRGVTAIELFVDPAPLIRLAQSEPMGAKVIEVLGAKHLTAVAMRMTLDGTMLHNGFFAAVAAPRSGILALIDQPELGPEVPAWVPANVIAYSHINADLGSVYAGIKAILVEQFPGTAMGFAVVEGWVRGFAQTDLTTLLSSLGHQHQILTWGVGQEFAKDAPKMTPVHFIQKMAVVWQITDETLWTRVLREIEAFAPNTSNDLQSTKEQGFRGWRLKKGHVEAGLFLGKGYLVLGHGQGVIEKTLSNLNNPPSGKEALRGSEIYTKSRTLIDLKPGLSFDISDGNRYIHMMRRVFDIIFRTALAKIVDDNSHAMVEQIRKVWPSKKELEHILGVSVGYARANENGLMMRSVNELSAPKVNR